MTECIVWDFHSVVFFILFFIVYPFFFFLFPYHVNLSNTGPGRSGALKLGDETIPPGYTRRSTCCPC